jgi:hypothetical protein
MLVATSICYQAQGYSSHSSRKHCPTSKVTESQHCLSYSNRNQAFAEQNYAGSTAQTISGKSSITEKTRRSANGVSIGL